jgi:hypothetical protein
MLGNHKFKPVKNTTSSNPLYKDFWDEQQRIRGNVLRARSEEEKKVLSELDKYKEDLIQKTKDEVKEYERTHGNSGNFLKDFKFGFKKGNEMFVKPFNKYVAPVLSSVGGPIGKSIGTASSGYSGVVDKLT